MMDCRAMSASTSAAMQGVGQKHDGFEQPGRPSEVMADNN